MTPRGRGFAIVPAAGRSVRMGRPKLLLPCGDETLIERVLRAWRASHVSSVVVTVHPEDHALATLCRDAGAEVVVPARPPREMKESIRLALQHAAEHCGAGPEDVWLLAPADMPELNASVIDRVLQAYDPRQPSILVPRHGGRRGHPVLFPWKLAAEVDHLGKDEGVNALLARHPIAEIDVEDEGVLEDLDTPEDHRRWQQRSGQ